MSDTNTTAILRADLRRVAPRHPAEVRDIEISLAALELRRAYMLMARLRESGKWQPSPDAETALEDFWWEYGQ